MFLLTHTTEAAVLAALAAARPLDQGSGPWTLRFVQRATQQFGGRWSTVELGGAEARAIVLPPHRGEPCRGDSLELVPAEGLTVTETARRLSDARQEYAAANGSCWGRIAAAMADPAVSALILTRQPLDAPDYATVRAESGCLYHLDGFHRLVGWMLSGRLGDDVRIRAFVAG